MVIALDEYNLLRIASAIKYLSDHHKIKFIVTGSSSYYLKAFFESLSGHKKLLNYILWILGNFLPSKKFHFPETLIGKRGSLIVWSTTAFLLIMKNTFVLEDSPKWYLLSLKLINETFYQILCLHM